MRGSVWVAFRLARTRVFRIGSLAVAIAAGVTLWSAVAISNDSVHAATRVFLSRFAGAGSVRVVGRTVTGGVTPAMRSSIEGLDSVARVVPVITELSSTSGANVGAQPVLVVGVDCSWPGLVSMGCTPGVLAAIGTQPFAIGPGLASARGVAVLHTDVGPLQIGDPPVRGELASMNDGRVVVMSLRGAAELFSRGDNVDSVFVSSRGGSPSSLGQSLERSLGDTATVARVDQEWPEVQKVLATILPLLGLLGWVTLIIVCLVALCLLRFDLESQRTQLAILGAVGSPPGGLVSVLLSTAVVGGFIGGVLGAAGGVLAATPMIDAMSGITEQSVGLHVPLTVHPSTVLVAALVGTGVAIVASIPATRRAMRLDVVTELGPRDRSEPSGATVPWHRAAVLIALQLVALGGISATGWRGGIYRWQAQIAAPLHAVLIVAMLLGWSAFASLTMHLGRPAARRLGGRVWLANENVVRDGPRTATTVLGIGAAVSLAMVIGGTLASITRGATSSLSGADYVAAERRVGPAEITAIDGVDGVARHERVGVVFLNTPHGLILAKVGSTAAQHYAILDTRGAAVTGHSEAVAIGAAVARDFGVRAGDSFEIGGPKRTARVRVAAVWDDGAFGGSNITVAPELASTLFVGISSEFVRWYPEHGVSAAQLHARIQAALGPTAPTMITRDQAARDIGRQTTAALRPFRVLQANLLIAAIISLGIMFATSVTNRRRELAALVALGETPMQVVRLLVAEGLLLGGVGCLLGLISGVILTAATVWIAPFSLGYRNPVVLDFGSGALSSGISILMILLASAFVAGLASRRNVATALSNE